MNEKKMADGEAGSDGLGSLLGKPQHPAQSVQYIELNDDRVMVNSQIKGTGLALLCRSYLCCGAVFRP